MVEFREINSPNRGTNNNKIEEEDDDDYDSNTFKSYKKYKEYKKKLHEVELNRPPNAYIEEKYFNCLHCGKVNLIEDVINEKSENRTMRAHYISWKKFKDISNDLGGSLENGLNYLIALHERKMMRRTGIPQDLGNTRVEDDYEVPIAGGTPDVERERLIDENLKRLGIKRKQSK